MYSNSYFSYQFEHSLSNAARKKQKTKNNQNNNNVKIFPLKFNKFVQSGYTEQNTNEGISKHFNATPTVFPLKITKKQKKNINKNITTNLNINNEKEDKIEKPNFETIQEHKQEQEQETDGFFIIDDELLDNTDKKEDQCQDIMNQQHQTDFEFDVIGLEKLVSATNILSEQNWIEILKENRIRTKEEMKKEFLAPLIKNGIPDSLKIPIWNFFGGCSEIELEYKNKGILYEDLIDPSQTAKKDIIQIDMDVKRSLNSDLKYTAEENQNLKKKLSNLLIAYSKIDPETGYVQGIFKYI